MRHQRARSARTAYRVLRNEEIYFVVAINLLMVELMVYRFFNEVKLLLNSILWELS